MPYSRWILSSLMIPWLQSAADRHTYHESVVTSRASTRRSGCQAPTWMRTVPDGTGSDALACAEGGQW